MANIFDLKEWPTAATHLYERYAPALSAQLRRNFVSCDSALVYDAVIEAVLDIALKLDQLDTPDDLHGLLFVAALRKLLGFLRSEGSRRCREREKGNASVAERQTAAR